MEQQPQPANPEQQRFKTLGVRVDEELHAQLTFIAQLTDSTIADEIRRSIEARVVAAQPDPDLIARAEEVRAELEREAHARQQAIAGLSGGLAVGSEPATPPPRSRPFTPTSRPCSRPHRWPLRQVSRPRSGASSTLRASGPFGWPSTRTWRSSAVSPAESPNTAWPTRPSPRSWMATPTPWL